MLFKKAKQQTPGESKDDRIYADLKQLIALQNRGSGASFVPTQPLHSVRAGWHASRWRGRGLNFEELRHYRIGDDIRSMDWKVTNRTRKPHVRVFTEERERSLLLLVDQRQSMFFGSQQKMKSVVATEIAALIAWQTLAAGDCVGALVFNDTYVSETRPQHSRSAVIRMLQQCVDMNHALAAGRIRSPGQVPVANQLDHVLGMAQRLCSHDCHIFLISDLSGCNALTVDRIKSLTQHNDVITSLVYDPLEQALPAGHRLVVSDGELQIAVDARQAKLAQRFTDGFDTAVKTLQQELKNYAVPVVCFDTVEPVQNQFKKLMARFATAAR